MTKKMIPQPSKFFCLLCSLWVLAVLCGCSTTQKPAASVPYSIYEDEKLLWHKAAEEQQVFDDSGLIYRDRKLDEYINSIVRKLQPQPAFSDLPIRVKILKNPYLNAFAYPNGVIYLHTGLLSRMDSEAQLVAVLAHELTHCTHRHALRAFREFKDKSAFFNHVQQTLMRIKGMQDLAKFLGITGSLIAVNGYMRELENEADQVGFELMVKAGYNPNEALFLFDHLVSEIEQEGLREPFFFGSHLKVQERIENWENLTKIKRPRQKPGVNDHPGQKSGWLGFYRHGREKKGARSAPIVAGGTGCEAPGLENPIKNADIFLAKIAKLILDNARLDLRIGRFQSASRGIKKYLQIKPDDTRAYFLLGEIYRQRGQADDAQRALSYYNRAISLDPNFADPHKAIGLIHYKKGDRTLAKKFFESCLQLSPNSPDKAYIQGYLKQCTKSGEG
jgi:predicted Zn-dependent protease